MVGEEVKKDELLAEKKGMFGTKQLISEFTGTIKEINHEDGSVTLEMRTEVNQEEFAYFSGRVTDIQGQVITLEVKEFKEFELKSANRDFGGETLKTTQDGLAALNADDVEKKVIVIDDIRPSDIVRLDVLEENGLITLKDIEPSASTNWARISTVQTWEEIRASTLSYCIVDSKNNTMYLYQ